MAPALAIHEHAAGLTWVHADEAMQRACHAVGGPDGVWLVDPTDAAEPLARAQQLGPVRGVVQLLDRHERAGAELAKRFDVPLHRLPEALPRSPFEVRPVLDLPRWREKALWWPERRTLVVAEVLGTNGYYRLGPGALGVHPFLRAKPPGALRAERPELLLVGHGPPLRGEDVPAAIEHAYARSRRDLVRLPGKLAGMLRGGR